MGGAALLLVSTAAVPVYADDQAEYNARAAARDAALFRSLDRDANGVLTRAEAKGDLDLGPRFDDIDIDRDGAIVAQELERYIGQRYGVTGKSASGPN
jgi:hypothetical protein